MDVDKSSFKGLLGKVQTKYLKFKKSLFIAVLIKPLALM
jgi:hypothetical protein